MTSLTTQQPEDVNPGTKQHIIDTARHLFSEHSYLGVSMNDIAKKINITKAALYYHFGGKTEIYQRVLENVFIDLSLSIKEALKESTAEKKLYKIIKNYLDFGLTEKNLIKALIIKFSPPDPQVTKCVVQLREQIADLTQPVMTEIVLNKEVSQKIDSRSITSLLISMMDGLLLEYSFLNKKIDSEKVANQIIAVLF